MKLSLKLILRQIPGQEARIAAVRRADPDAMRLTAWMLYTPGEQWEESAVYVAAAETLAPDFSCPRGIALIVVGHMDPERFAEADADVLLWETEQGAEAFARRANQLSAIFREYQQVERRILERLAVGAAPEEIAVLGEALLGNPIVVMDEGYALLLKPRRTNPLDWEPGRYPQAPALSAETVDQIRMSREYRSREENQGLFYLSGDTLDCGALFLNVQDDGIVLFIAVLEMDQPITPADRQLLCFFSRYICHSLRTHRFSRADSLYFLQFLTKLLRNEKIELPEFHRQLHTLQWRITQNYVVFVGEPDLWNQRNAQLFSLCRMVERRFRGCCAFEQEGRVVCILNLDQAGMSREAFLQLLSQFIRDQLLRVGVSYGFQDFVSLASYYHQALAALELGRELAPEAWSYRFETYVLEYFIRYGTSRMEGKYLCHPDLIALLHYDRENHTELLQTLRVYLNCGQNATAAAEELFIHRNTLYQRLGKIDSLISSSLSNPENRLYLQISYSIADFDAM